MVSSDGLFGDAQEFPDDGARERFAALVGLDSAKQQLLAHAQVLLDSTLLAAWSTEVHGCVIPAVEDAMNRPPLVVLAGDVGTGKSELAETVGDAIARLLGVSVALFPLSLTARGHGAVGEMTTLLTRAFQKVQEHAASGRGRDGRLRHATVLLIDEADALAQSREMAQMHHEDRAGVNALLRGIDALQRERMAVLVIMCTNRADALDPAVLRRAAAVFHFTRPNEVQRRLLLDRSFAGVPISDECLREAVRLTGPMNGRGYGCTYSDMRQRLVPGVVLDALAGGGPIEGARLVGIAQDFQPTRPFDAELVGSR